MANPINILYKPKSILGLLIAVGLLFIFTAGTTLTWAPQISQYFDSWGRTLLYIGLAIWGIYLLPTILRMLPK